MEDKWLQLHRYNSLNQSEQFYLIKKALGTVGVSYTSLWIATAPACVPFPPKTKSILVPLSCNQSEITGNKYQMSLYNLTIVANRMRYMWRNKNELNTPPYYPQFLLQLAHHVKLLINFPQIGECSGQLYV